MITANQALSLSKQELTDSFVFLSRAVGIGKALLLLERDRLYTCTWVSKDTKRLIDHYMEEGVMVMGAVQTEAYDAAIVHQREFNLIEAELIELLEREYNKAVV